MEPVAVQQCGRHVVQLISRALGRDTRAELDAEEQVLVQPVHGVVGALRNRPRINPRTLSSKRAKHRGAATQNTSTDQTRPQ